MVLIWETRLRTGLKRPSASLLYRVRFFDFLLFFSQCRRPSLDVKESIHVRTEPVVCVHPSSVFFVFKKNAIDMNLVIFVTVFLFKTGF